MRRSLERKAPEKRSGRRDKELCVISRSTKNSRKAHYGAMIFLAARKPSLPGGSMILPEQRILLSTLMNELPLLEFTAP